MKNRGFKKNLRGKFNPDRQAIEIAVAEFLAHDGKIEKIEGKKYYSSNPAGVKGNSNWRRYVD